MITFGYPFDTVKVHLQSKPELYKNSYHVVKHIVKTQGPYGLYQGLSAPLIIVIPLSALTFFSFALGKFLVANREISTNLQSLCSGVFSGACTSVASAPSERIKTLLQVEDASRKYRGLNKCIVTLWKEGGIRNFYVGTCATLLRDVPACVAYFMSYERLMELLVGSSNEVTWQPLVAGGIAGMLSWAITMPADTMKTRLQISPMGAYPRGMRSLLPIILKEGGISTFFVGFWPIMLRAFLANAACFYTFELWLQFTNMT